MGVKMVTFSVGMEPRFYEKNAAISGEKLESIRTTPKLWICFSQEEKKKRKE